MTLPLEGLRVAISISESPDLTALGMTPLHVHQLLVTLVRHLIASGARTAYGGDLRAGGFTRALFEFAATYEAPGCVADNYLAWPIGLTLAPAERSELEAPVDGVQRARLCDVPPPADLVGPGRLIEDPKVFVPPADASGRYVWARNLLAMRRRMARITDARIVLGGRTTGFLGRYPGVVEEAAETIRLRRPLFVAAGFGGAAGSIWRALDGEMGPGLDPTDHDDAWRDMAAFYNAEVAAERCPTQGVDLPALRARFGRAGVAGLRNGLSDDENAQLAATTDATVICRLILRGLAACAARRSETDALHLLLDAPYALAPKAPPPGTADVLADLEALPDDEAPGYFREVAELLMRAHPSYAPPLGEVAVRGGEAGSETDDVSSVLALLRDDLPALAALIADLRTRVSPAAAAAVFGPDR